MKSMHVLLIVAAALLAAASACGKAPDASADAAPASTSPASKDTASEATRAANQAVLEYLPFKDVRDFENAKRGFIATLNDKVIRGEAGNLVIDLGYYDFIEGDAPDTVTRAASELQEYIERSTGARLSILTDQRPDAGIGHFVLDHGFFEFNLQEVAVHPDNFTDVFAHNLNPLSQ